MSNIRLTPVRVHIPTKAKGGFVDLLVDDGCSVKEFRERVVMESKRTALDKHNFVVAGDTEGKQVFAEDTARLLDPKHEMGFDLGSGKLEVYIRLVGDEWLNQYTAVPATKKREAPPLPEEVLSRPPCDNSVGNGGGGAIRESIYHAFRKAKTGRGGQKKKDEDFDIHQKRLRELLVYAETLRRQVQAFEATIRAVCLECKSITDTLAQRLADDDQEHSYTRMVMQAQNVASEEMGPGKADSVTNFLCGRLVGGLDELVEDLAARVGKVGHRNHLWREYTYYQAKVEDLQKKQPGPAAAPKHQQKLVRNHEKLQRATEAFENYHAELLRELVELWRGRHELIGPLLADWIELQQALFVDMGKAIRRVPTEPNLAVSKVSDTESEADDAEDDRGSYGAGHVKLNPFAAEEDASPPDARGRRSHSGKNPFGSDGDEDFGAGRHLPGSVAQPALPHRSGRSASRGSNPFGDDDHHDEAGSGGQPVVRPSPSMAPAVPTRVYHSRHQSAGSVNFSPNSPVGASVSTPVFPRNALVPVPAVSPKLQPRPVSPRNVLQPAAVASHNRSRSFNPFGGDDSVDEDDEEDQGDDDYYRDRDIRVLYEATDSDDDIDDDGDGGGGGCAAGGPEDDVEPGNGPSDPFRSVLGPRRPPASSAAAGSAAAVPTPATAAPQLTRRPLPKGPNPNRPPPPSNALSAGAPAVVASAASVVVAPAVPARPAPKPQVPIRRVSPAPSTNPFD